jgi:hypothetical protein
VSLLQIVWAHFFSQNPICLQASFPRTSIHEHCPTDISHKVHRLAYFINCQCNTSLNFNGCIVLWCQHEDRETGAMVCPPINDTHRPLNAIAKERLLYTQKGNLVSFRGSDLQRVTIYRN